MPCSSSTSARSSWRCARRAGSASRSWRSSTPTATRSCDLIVRVIADGIAAGQRKATPADFTRRAEAAPEAAEPAEPTVPEADATVPEGDYEQVSAGEEPIAEAAQPPVRDSGPVEGARGNREAPPTEEQAAPQEVSAE